MGKDTYRLTKRGRVWHAYFYENGVRRLLSTRCTDLKGAELKLRQFERDGANPAHAATQKASLTDALRLLLQRRTEEATAGRKSHETVAFYKRKAGHLTRLFEHSTETGYQPFLLKELTAADVDSYISRRRAEAVSDHTIAKELVTLRAALKLAKRAGLWLGEIDALLPAGFAPEYRPRTRALSSEELGQLLGRLPTARAAQVAFIVATSACWSESVRARREDVQLDSGWVHVRGTKRAARNRRIAIRHPALASLLNYALKHAPGEDELFPAWTNVRRDLHLACAQAGIEACSPNDLRRTYAKWMRLARVPAEIVAPTMGHRDTRMVERVYGRLSPEEIGALLSAHFADCITGVADKVDLGGKNGRNGPLRTAKGLKSVPRGGIEPPTRGFSVPCSTD
jgi:integrase